MNPIREKVKVSEKALSVRCEREMIDRGEKKDERLISAHTQNTQPPLSLRRRWLSFRECGDGCNLYRYAAKVFTPTRANP